MKKTILAACIGMLSLTAQAGMMGPVTSDLHVVPYLSGEASYTWNSLNGASVNYIPAVITKNGWGGRLAAGMVYPLSQQWGLNAEAGGGYYGKIHSDLSARGVVANTHIDGYDFLVGATYHARLIDIFGDFGVMAQNMQFKVTRDNALRFPGGMFKGVQRINADQTQMLPEVKVGGLYNLSQYVGGYNLALTVAYLHVFGSSISSNSFSITDPGSPASIANAGTVEQRNLSLDSILFGLRYNFA